MAKYIMLALIGILLTFIILDVAAVIGLSALSNKLEKKISISHINEDITFIESNLNKSDTTILSCKNIGAKVPGLKKYHLPKKSSTEEIESARLHVLNTSHGAVQCYKAVTENCVSNHSESCTLESLYILAEYINMTGRHMNEKFNDRENEVYKKIIRLYEGDSTKDKVIELAKVALPVFENIMQRLDISNLDRQMNNL